MLTKHEAYEAVMLLIRSTNPKFSKDGNQYCFLLGENIQEGAVGFGDTAWEAALNFYNDFFGVDYGNKRSEETN